MMHYLRLFLMLGVILGVVLPKSSAALADMGLIDDRMVVICTGHGLIQVSLADLESGNPDPAPGHEDACLLVHALDHAVPPSAPIWVRLASQLPPLVAADIWRSSQTPVDGFARAPPRV
ncbi:hypothetical protein [Paracoccus sp. JM45]|uniref:DUF2946 family protein n=1 Tax=Paracoccus sp. JM45 TaxID=2283626 RepID=UPI000E6C04FC|nr:hypothetical protein [Paracoccus sp. JM45]RJE80236.1 hypothetical protein DWB67_08580 [Paracoccus sp. JM45]